MITDHRAFVPSLDSLLSADRLLSNNLYFSMDKETFCPFMEMHGYQVDKTVMPAKSTTLKFTNKTKTILFQKVTIDNKRLFTVLMISYKEGDVRSIVFNYDGSFYEITYRSDKDFHIVKKTSLSRYNDGTIYYQFVVHNSLHSKCYLSSFCLNKGVIKDVLYFINNKCYPLNKLLNALGRPEIDVSAESDYLKLVNLFTDDDAILIEMAMC
jgi:hypothetical protein